MLLTIWCVVVVCGSIFAVGTPVRWLLNSREPLTPSAWVEVPFYGIAAIILFLQNLVYLDVPVSRSTWILWAVVAVLWVWMARRGGATSSLRTCPARVFACAALVYLLQGLGLFIIGARHYVGRAWGDQYNYTALAQFLTDYTFSAALTDIGQPPYLVEIVRLKTERLGQSVLHAFFAATGHTDAKVLFEPTILLSPLLITLAVFALSKRYGLKPGVAVACGMSAGLLPAVALVHLEGFLSQALAIPFLLLAPVLIDDLSKLPRWSNLFGTAMLFAATASIYPEFLVLLIAVAAAGLLFLDRRRGLVTSRWAWIVLLLIVTVALNIGFAGGLLSGFGRVNMPVLGHIYPWALSVEGIVRAWFGDLGGSSTGIMQSILRASALGLTAVGYYGLRRAAVLRATDAAAGKDAQETPGRAFPWITLGLAALPAVVLVRDDQHPYQFYKLLLTIAPLLVVGVTLAVARLHAVSRAGSAATDGQVTRRWAAGTAWVLWTAVLAAAVTGTIAMALETTSSAPAPRSNAHYLLRRDMRELGTRLSALRDERLFISVSDDTWNHGFLNAWLTYFARHNKLWLANPSLNDTDLRRWPEFRGAIGAPDHPRDMLVLTSADMPMPASFSPPATKIWSVGAYELWRAPGDWVYPLSIDNPNGIDGSREKPTLWLGGGATTIRVFVSRDGEFQIVASVLSGPGLDGQVHRVRMSEPRGHSTVLAVAEGIDVLSIPVRGGLNEIRLEPLGHALPPLPGRDTRPLVVGLQEPRLALDDKWVVLSRTVNPNGLERLDGQPFFWMGGQQPTTIEVLTGRAGLVRFDAEVIAGPSIPNDVVRRVRAVTDDGHSQTLVTRGGGSLGLVVPIPKGRHQVRLYAVDHPTVTLAHDRRALVVGLKGFTVSVESEIPAASPATDAASTRPNRDGR
jgi:hypothetical protein